MNDKIKELQKQIAAEEAKMLNCFHVWGDAFYNPETKKEGYGYKMVTQGSDAWGEFAGYHDVNVPRWTRVCTKCGKEDHTYKESPVIKGYQPDFSK